MDQSKLVIIKTFYPLKIEFPVDATPDNKCAEYRMNPEASGYLPNFPIILQKDGQPWSIGNLYLVRLALDIRGPRYSYENHKQHASALLDYMRFIDKHEELHFAIFPDIHRRRPTYRYRYDLIDRANTNKLNLSTCSLRINKIVSFYRTIAEWGLLEESLISDGIAFQQINKTISYINSAGFLTKTNITSSDLAIKTTSASSDPDAIQDEGSLIPLLPDEQNTLFEALKGFSRGIQLMFAMAVTTGARLQTVGTLRIKHVENAKINKKGYAIIPYGGNHDLDGKSNRFGRLWVPVTLINALKDYYNSEIADNRRKLSFYRNSDKNENYVFLTRNGTPYYTSRREMNEKRSKRADFRVKPTDAIERESTKKGDAIGVLIRQEILPNIRKSHPNFPSFSFHDLRATFGMNLLEDSYRAIDNINHRRKMNGQKLIGYSDAVDLVQKRLNHKNRIVTERYIKHRDRTEWKAQLMNEFESRLIGNFDTLEDGVLLEEQRLLSNLIE